MASLCYWFAALAAVGSLYAPALIGERSEALSAGAALVIGGSLALAAFSRSRSAVAREPARGSIALLILAVALFTVSSIAAAFTRPFEPRDIGVFALQAVVPIVLLASPRRAELLTALGWMCVAFAGIDAAANLVAAAGLIELPAYGGRMDQAGVHIRYPGLSGNTLAAGLVAFLAVCALARRPSSWRLALIALLLISLWLIDARRYLALAVFATPLLVWRPAWRLPLPLVSIAIGAVGLTAAFSPVFGDELRGLLIRQGLDTARGHLLLGLGPQWRDTSELAATFTSLSDVGVTESGWLDLAVAYGALAAAALGFAALLAMGARNADRFAAVLLALLTASLAFSDPLDGYLGALAFFGALAGCQVARKEGAVNGVDDHDARRA